MRYLTLLLLVGFYFTSVNLAAQFVDEDELDFINYMTNPEDPKVLGSGEPIVEERSLEEYYNEITIGNGIEAFIIYDNTEAIRIEAQKNILPLISSEIINNNLIFRLSASLKTTEGIKVYIQLNTSSKITVKEGSYLYFDYKIPSLELSIESGSIVDCKVFSEHFNCTLMGGSTLNIEGKISDSADIFINGGSILKGKKFECATTKAIVLGASKCKLKIGISLDARVENESIFIYTGSPTTVQKSTRKKGKIKRRRF